SPPEVCLPSPLLASDPPQPESKPISITAASDCMYRFIERNSLTNYDISRAEILTQASVFERTYAEYSRSIADLYFFSMSEQRSFIVGVNSPPSMLNSPSRNAIFLTFSKEDKSCVRRSISLTARL